MQPVHGCDIRGEVRTSGDRGRGRLEVLLVFLSSGAATLRCLFRSCSLEARSAGGSTPCSCSSLAARLVRVAGIAA